MASSSEDSPGHLPNSAARASDGSVHAISTGKVDTTGEVPSMNYPANEEETERSPKLGRYRLYAVAIGVLFGALMMAIDISIIGTVSSYLIIIQSVVEGWHELTDCFG